MTIVTRWTEIWHGEGRERVNILADREKTMGDSLRETDKAAAAVAVNPKNRVTLDQMLARIEHEEYWHPSHTPHMTICVLTIDNGFVVVGSSAPADPANYDENLGRQFSKEDCIRQMWRLEGYRLRDKLWMIEREQDTDPEAAQVDTGGPQEGAGDPSS